LTTTFSYESRAQLNTGAPFEICYPDCETDLWVPNPNMDAITILINVCNPAIELEVRYRWRFACGQYYDIYIEGIGEGSGSLAGALNCHGQDIGSLLNEVTEQLLIINPQSFPPLGPRPECETNWRVMNGSCWTFSGRLFGMGDPAPVEANFIDPLDWIYNVWLQPCPDIECCLEIYTVCFDPITNTRTISLTSEDPADPNCTQQMELNSGDCTPVCGSTYR
jgi:hypothetical protein